MKSRRITKLSFQAGAGQSMLSTLENDILGNAVGLEALDGALTRATDALLKRKDKKRLIISRGTRPPASEVICPPFKSAMTSLEKRLSKRSCLRQSVSIGHPCFEADYLAITAS